MTRFKRDSRKLKDWILMEAYRNGLARQGGICPTGPNGSDVPEGYYISRYAIYQGFFKLPIDAFFQGGQNTARARRCAASRLRCSAMLCESVRSLLRDGLIRFPGRVSTKWGATDAQEALTTFIGLTAAGMRMAESLLLPPAHPNSLVNEANPSWVLSTS